MQGHDGAVLALKFLPDQTLITAGRDRTVRQWDMLMFRVARVIAEGTFFILVVRAFASAYECACLGAD